MTARKTKRSFGRKLVAWNLLQALAPILLGPAAFAEEAAPAPAPEAAAPVEKTPVDLLLDQLLTIDPALVRESFDKMKGESDALVAELDALRAKTAELEAKAEAMRSRLALLDRVLGVVAPTDTAAAPAPAEAAAAPAMSEEEMKAAEAKKMEEMKTAEAKKAEEAKMAAAANAGGDKPKVTYKDNVAPIFMAKCASCHNQDKAKGGFAVETFEKVMAGGSSGAVVVAGDAGGSRLFRLLTHEEEPKMPQGGAKLDDATLATIRAWIDGGALKDKNSKVQVAKGPTLAMDAAAAPQIVVEGELPIPIKQEGVAPAPLEGHLAVRAIAASPVAPVVAVSGQRQILMYNADDLTLLAAFDFPEGVAESIRFSPNGSLLVAAGGEAGKVGLAAVYDVVTGARVGEFGSTFDTVLSADISLDHMQVAVGGSSKKVRVYDTRTGEQQYEVTKHTDWIQSVAFSPDGWFLATADRAGGLFVWQAETGRDVHELRGHGGAINAVDFRPDSNVLASASVDGQVMLWEMSDGRNLKKWTAHGAGVLAVRFARDGRVVTSGADRVAAIWDGEGKELVKFPALDDWAYAACFASEDKRVFAGTWQGVVRAFEVASAQEVAAFTLGPQ